MIEQLCLPFLRVRVLSRQEMEDAVVGAAELCEAAVAAYVFGRTWCHRDALEGAAFWSAQAFAAARGFFQ